MAISEAEALDHPAVIALVEWLEAALTVALARIAKLEARVGGPPRTPKNSSLPPSSAFKADRAEPAVPPTNNSSEPALRPPVIHRKVTNGFALQAGQPAMPHFARWPRPPGAAGKAC